MLRPSFPTSGGCRRTERSSARWLSKGRATGFDCEPRRNASDRTLQFAVAPRRATSRYPGLEAEREGPTPRLLLGCLAESECLERRGIPRHPRRRDLSLCGRAVPDVV